MSLPEGRVLSIRTVNGAYAITKGGRQVALVPGLGGPLTRAEAEAVVNVIVNALEYRPMTWGASDDFIKEFDERGRTISQLRQIIKSRESAITGERIVERFTSSPATDAREGIKRERLCTECFCRGYSRPYGHDGPHILVSFPDDPGPIQEDWPW